MKTANSAKYISIISASIFFLVAIAIYIAFYQVLPRPFFQERPIELRAKIESLKDIEQLREVALKVDTLSRSDLKLLNNLLAEAVELLIILCIAAGILFSISILFLKKLLREQKDECLP
jgi:hypothetical protein